eukprot:CAMPEP_0117083900 /NCGR_PEP_ID=MMETSP0472-20121206/59067_1 /TAXON_ID=693140 ORGANISM="Tiarina fusus, Strain LIS" /NCGR_SAMPLE_ID=MMETSP0472 /ASSEMBLY_ACC=CAM_ASM_000603 /LENGTH=823 /DNA_ID=CAMNT_0004812705 /DNA_START=85 /DNA_END=2557 /DNA_ORIENTATION=-
MSNESKNDSNDEENALQELLDEAESLMNNLNATENSTSIVIEGFSIDSDDDEGGDEKGSGRKIETEDHPLSDERLLTQPKVAHSPKLGHPLLQTPAGLSIGGPSGGQPGHATGANPATIDAFKQQTSRFASNLASMAQRAASQVAAVTAPAPVVATSAHPHQSGVVSAFGLDQGSSVGGPVVSKQGPGVPHGVELDKEQKIDLLPGERVIMFMSNLLHVSDTSGLSYVMSQSQGKFMWCCAMSYYRLILFSTADRAHLEIPAPSGWNKLCWSTPPMSKKMTEIPLASIDRVEKAVYQAAGSSYMGLEIYAKDCGRIIRFSTPSFADTGRAFDSLNTYAFPGRRNLGYLFAFESKRQEVMDSVKVDESTGQQNITIAPTAKRFDAMIEYSRLLSKTTITQSPWALWAAVNSNYQLSATYPSVLVGPATLDETNVESQQVIIQCAAFRSEKRLPSMTWCGTGGASIWRAAQPKVGLQGNRSAADELFLRHISESARGANAMAETPHVFGKAILQQLTGEYLKDWVPEPGCGLKILDLRPRSAAMANRTGGYGYENTSNYPTATLQFCNITNIHGVRDSYQKLCTVCNSLSTADVNWTSLVEDTKWLAHIRAILAASWETAYWVHVWRLPVFLHCSHGWDRTSQVAALSQLFLDPFYRTKYGFSVLVEKDFMSFGHPFHLRCAHGEGRNDKSSQSQTSTDEGQISPIFLQFLDCVYQIVHLYPECFEFNASYLLELSFHIYSCRFGNMLCDTEREREVLAGIRQRTYSIWDYLDQNKELDNQGYQECEGALLMPLPTLLRGVSLWQERHCSFSPKPTLRKGLETNH